MVNCWRIIVLGIISFNPEGYVYELFATEYMTQHSKSQYYVKVHELYWIIHVILLTTYI